VRILLLKSIFLFKKKVNKFKINNIKCIKYYQLLFEVPYLNKTKEYYQIRKNKTSFKWQQNHYNPFLL
jgi:hypothetical protein